MSPEAAELLAGMRRDGLTVFTEDGRLFYVVVRTVPPPIVKELYGAGVLDAVRSFPRGWLYSAFPAEAEVPSNERGPA